MFTATLLCAQSDTIQKAKVTQFAKAMIAIEKLNKQLQQEVMQTRGEQAVQQKIQKIKKEFKQRSTQIVLKHGFHKQEYLDYAKKFQKKEAFKKKVLEAVKNIQ